MDPFHGLSAREWREVVRRAAEKYEQATGVWAGGAQARPNSEVGLPEPYLHQAAQEVRDRRNWWRSRPAMIGAWLLCAGVMSGVWWGAAGRYADVSLATLDFPVSVSCTEDTAEIDDDACGWMEFKATRPHYYPYPTPNTELAPPPFTEPQYGEEPPRIKFLDRDLPLWVPGEHPAPEVAEPSRRFHRFNGDAYSWRVEVTPGTEHMPDDEDAAEETEERDEAN